jgi:hypothetical protein
VGWAPGLLLPCFMSPPHGHDFGLGTEDERAVACMSNCSHEFSTPLVSNAQSGENRGMDELGMVRKLHGLPDGVGRNLLFVLRLRPTDGHI